MTFEGSERVFGGTQPDQPGAAAWDHRTFSLVMDAGVHYAQGRGLPLIGHSVRLTTFMKSGTAFEAARLS